jgi:hypothetical protein
MFNLQSFSQNVFASFMMPIQQCPSQNVPSSKWLTKKWPKARTKWPKAQNNPSSKQPKLNTAQGTIGPKTSKNHIYVFSIIVTRFVVRKFVMG